MAQDWPGLVQDMNPQVAALRGLQPDGEAVTTYERPLQ